MGSLNGTFLNSKSINHPDTESRHWGDPINLANGDIITLGTTSKVIVSIMFPFQFKPLPFYVLTIMQSLPFIHDIGCEEVPFRV